MPKRIPDIQTPKSPEGESSSILFEETSTMERQRRILEQQYHSRLTKVHARNHEERSPGSPESAPENGLLPHPYLDSQRNDGIDPGLNPEPPLNTDARREFDNKRREQDMEKQLRLGNMPKLRTDPQFKP